MRGVTGAIVKVMGRHEAHDVSVYDTSRRMVMLV